MKVNAAVAASITRYQSELKAYILRHLHLRSQDGAPWNITFEKELIVTEREDPVDLVATLRLTPPAQVSPRTFTLESDLVEHQVVSHKTFVVLKSDWKTGVFSNESKLLDVLRYLNNSVRVDLGEGSAWRGFLGTFKIGIRHIAEGTDHLLFLFMLMLPAPLSAKRGRWAGFVGVKASLSQLIKIVTAFTLGHSLTLIIGAVGWLRPPPAPVEILIAGSVLVTAVHAFRPIFPLREFWIAAGFGLIHGLAFSTVVAEFGLGARELALSVLGFNLGIEAMQLALVCAAVPALLVLAKTSRYHWVSVPSALFGMVMAGVWLRQRLPH